LSSGGLEIIAFFQSPPEIIKKYAGRQNPPFPVISDPKLKFIIFTVFKNPGPEYLKGFMRFSEWMEVISKGFFHYKPEEELNIMPADFLINPDLTIHTAYYGKDIGDHLSINIIKEFAYREK